MPNVTIDLKELSGVTPGVDNLKDAIVWFYPFSPYGSPLVTTDKLVVPTTLGVATTFLPESPVGNYMWAQIRGVRLPSDQQKRLVQIPATDCNLFDLELIDPASLGPIGPPTPAFVAALNTAVPLGGTTGQVLAKASDADHDDVWITSLGATDSGVAGYVASGTLTGPAVDARVTAGITGKADTSALTAEATARAAADALLEPKASLDADTAALVASGTLTGPAVDARVAAGIASKANTSALTAETTARTNADTMLTTALTSKADLVGGVVPTSQIPAIALSTGTAYASRAAMLADATVQPGDFGSITATADKGTYILQATPSSTFTNWLPLSVPTDVVQSVNGQNGVVVLAKTDVALGSVDNTADTAKPVSTAQQTALNLKAPLASPAFTGTPTGITKAHVGLGNVDNTSDLAKPVSTAQTAAFQPLDSDLTAIAALSTQPFGRLLLTAPDSASVLSAVGAKPNPFVLATGEANMDRAVVTFSDTSSLSPGQQGLRYFVATKTESISQIKMVTASVAAGATPTLCKMAVFSVHPTTGDLTLVGVTTNNTTLFAATYTAYTESLVAPFTKVAGTKYATGPLVVTSGVSPSFTGMATGTTSVNDTLYGATPRVMGLVGGLSDVPATVLNSAIGSTRRNAYCELLP